MGRLPVLQAVPLDLFLHMAKAGPFRNRAEASGRLENAADACQLASVPVSARNSFRRRPSMRKTATSRDLFAKLEDEFAKPPIAKGKTVKPAKAGKRGAGSPEDAYTAADIEVLEGLEPVRRRPGMYIGGTDEKAMHHLFAEVLDNAMDEAVEGHANRIEVAFEEDGFLSVTDNGRGIPVDPHPKFKNKSALEVIMTTLHSGGKFDSRSTTRQAACMASASRWQTRCRRSSRSRWRAGRSSTGKTIPRQTGRPDEKSRAGEEPARHQGALQARPQDFRQGGRLHAGAAVPHVALQGLSVRRGRDPLVLRCRAPRFRHGDPAKRSSAFPGRPQGLSRKPHRGSGDRDQGDVHSEEP